VVPQKSFSDATLLLIAHGSTVNAESAIAPLKHAATLEQSHVFSDVRVCFWQQPPFIRETLASVQSPGVFIVPVFLSDGYFTTEIIPRELGFPTASNEAMPRVDRRSNQTLFYTQPIGTSARMTDVILARAVEVIAQTGNSIPDSATALVLAAHGTSRNSDSRRAAEWHVQRIRSLNRFAEVHTAFMEEEPRIRDTVRFTNAPNIIVVPFFISDGQHAREDVPVLLGESPDAVQQRLRSNEPTFINPTERGGKRIWYSASIGTAPLVAEVILDRVREAARWGSNQ